MSTLPQPTDDVEPTSGRLRARMVDDKVVFTNQAGPGEIDYDEGVDKWQANALDTQRPSDPRARGLDASGQVEDFLVKKTPARDPGSETGFRGGYIPSAEVPLDLPADARGAQAAIAGIPHMGAREMATEQWLGDEQLRQAAARRSLIEAEAGRTSQQGEAAGAEGRLLGVRADQIADPVANAVRQGRASAEQILSFKARLTEQAAAEVDPVVVTQIANEMVLRKMAPNQAAAEKMARDKLVAAKVQEFIANDPGLQRYFIQQTGSVGVGGMQ